MNDDMTEIQEAMKEEQKGENKTNQQSNNGIRNLLRKTKSTKYYDDRHGSGD